MYFSYIIFRYFNDWQLRIIHEDVDDWLSKMWLYPHPALVRRFIFERKPKPFLSKKKNGAVASRRLNFRKSTG